jgi:hypothetical protein
VSGTTTKVRAKKKENLDIKKEKNGGGARKKNGMKAMMNGKNQQGRHHSLIKEESIP